MSTDFSMPGPAARVSAFAKVRRVLLAAAVCAVCSCQMYGTSGGLVKGTGWNGASAAGISISQFSFNPGTVSFPTGDNVVVTWTNNDPGTHTVTSDTGAFVGSGNIGPGMTFSLGPLPVGTYAYHCSIHTYMTGSFTVTP